MSNAVVLKIIRKVPLKLGLALFFLLSVFGAGHVYAASFYINPSSGSYPVGGNFVVSIYVNSSDQSMNAAQGIITFPADILEVTQVVKTSSIITLWAQDPSYSNTYGTVQFEGIIPNPGFSEINGKLISIYFRAKKPGNAALSITQGSVLANDGLGTQILQGVSGATFNVVPSSQNNPVMIPVVTGQPPFSAPLIISTTHPDQNKWYNNNNPIFSWEVPDGATSVRLLYDKNPSSIPDVEHTPPISSKNLSNIPDGVWYFHVQLGSSNGWGRVANYKFQIDTTPPDSTSVAFEGGNLILTQTPTIIISSHDNLSGVARYDISINDGNIFSVDANQTASTTYYTLPQQRNGDNAISIMAVDWAGNASTIKINFKISAVNIPQILSYRSQIAEGDSFSLSGKADPNSTVRIFIQNNTNNNVDYQDVAVGGDPLFSVTLLNPLYSGSYELWAREISYGGVQSDNTPHISFLVYQKFMVGIEIFISNNWKFLIIILIFIASIIAVWIIMTRRRVNGISVKLKKKYISEVVVHELLANLIRDVVKHIDRIEKRHLKIGFDEEERQIISDLKNSVAYVEEKIDKEIEKFEHKK